MRRIIVAASAAVALALCSQASAATVLTGSLSGGTSLSWTGNQFGISTPGIWEVKWETSVPTEVWLSITFEHQYDLWVDGAQTPDGNEFEYNENYTDFRLNGSGSFRVRVENPFRVFEPGDRPGSWWIHQSRVVGADFYLGDGAEPVTYKVTTQYISAVPEPTTWAIMIIGFGATGSLLRRQRKAAEAA